MPSNNLVGGIQLLVPLELVLIVLFFGIYTVLEFYIQESVRVSKWESMVRSTFERDYAPLNEEKLTKYKYQKTVRNRVGLNGKLPVPSVKVDSFGPLINNSPNSSQNPEGKKKVVVSSGNKAVFDELTSFLNDDVEKDATTIEIENLQKRIDKLTDLAANGENHTEEIMKTLHKRMMLEGKVEDARGIEKQYPEYFSTTTSTTVHLEVDLQDSQEYYIQDNYSFENFAFDGLDEHIPPPDYDPMELYIDDIELKPSHKLELPEQYQQLASHKIDSMVEGEMRIYGVISFVDSPFIHLEDETGNVQILVGPKRCTELKVGNLVYCQVEKNSNGVECKRLFLLQQQIENVSVV